MFGCNGHPLQVCHGAMVCLHGAHARCMPRCECRLVNSACHLGYCSGLCSAYVVMAEIVMAYIIMAHVVMAHVVMAYIVMAAEDVVGEAAAI